MTDNSRLVNWIVETVAENENVQPEDLPSMETAIASTTFTKLTTDWNAQTKSIEFSYVWYDVVVHPDGEVIVTP